MKRAARGFSMVELMIVVAIAGILTAIALPKYNEYVIRTKLTEAFAGLGGVQLSAEEFWQTGRTYAGYNRQPAGTANFTYAVSGTSASGYTVTATGIGALAGFRYTINQNGERGTAAVPSGWTLTSTCWVDRRNGSCTQ
ncbi:MAG: type IV pilin protein [Pseudomonadota bacterium]